MTADPRSGPAAANQGFPYSASSSRTIPATGIADPVGTVVELVAQLVDGLLGLEDREQLVRGLLAGRQQRAVHGLVVALEEALARTLLPAIRRVDAAQQLRARRHVGERAQHPRDVAQRRALQAPLRQRPRGLALEVEHDPAAVAEHRLAEVQVAVGADHLAAGADVRQRAELLAHVLAAAADRRGRLGLGQLEEDALDLLVDVGGQDRQRLHRRLVGRERRVGVVRAERGVQLADHGAERAELVQQPFGIARRARPARAPTRRGSRAGTPAGCPSVASIRRPSTSYQPASEAMCGKPWALRKRSSSSSGFTPGSILRNAFMISWSPKTIEELDCSTPTGRTSTVPPSAGARVRRPAEDELVLADLELAVGAHPVQQLAAGGGVGERVVDRPAVGLDDHALGPALLDRAQPERHLVGLVRPRREARLDEAQDDRRRLLAQRHLVDDLDLA